MTNIGKTVTVQNTKKNTDNIAFIYIVLLVRLYPGIICGSKQNVV